MVQGEFAALMAMVFSTPRHAQSQVTSADMYCLNSRQAIQKYIKANNNLGEVSDAMFKSHVNRAIASGEKSDVFLRPKGEFRAFRPG